MIGVTALALTRRTVLAAVAAAAAPAAPGKPGTLRLLGFALSSDGGSLEINEHEQPLERDAANGTKGSSNRPNVPAAPVASWLVPVRAFGPRATFDMEAPSEPAKDAPRYRVVVIRNVGYAGTPVFELRLVFGQTGDAAPWHIAFAGTPWQKGAAPSLPIPFEQFCRNTMNGPVTLALSGSVGLFVDTVFMRRVHVDAPNGAVLAVSLNRDCAWRFDIWGPGAFTAFEGAVRLPQLVLRWALDAQPGKTPRWVMTGEAANTEDTPFQLNALHLGERRGHHVRLSGLQGALATLDVRLAPAPQLRSLQQVVLCLSLHRGVLDILDGGQRLVGPLPILDLAVTDSVLPGGIARQTISGFTNPAFGAMLETPVGRLHVATPDLERTAAAPTRALGPAPPVSPAGTPDKAQPYTPRPAAAAAASRLFVAAGGDKGGVRDATMFVVHDTGAGPGKALRRVDAAVALLEADAGVQDASDSRLEFQDADLRVHFEDGHPLFYLGRLEYPRQLASSWVWAGPLDPASRLPRGSLDLSRATLNVRRDEDLVRLGFRFHDLILAFTPAPQIRPRHEDCRVIARTDGVLVDDRPLLVVEFPPQHVMEEAVFRPNPPPLPDVALDDPATPAQVLAELAKRCGPEKVGERFDYRRSVQGLKSQKSEAFKQFAEAFETLPIVKALPEEMRDQGVYIGPFVLDPDLMAAARTLFRTEGESAIDATIGQVLKRVEQLAGPQSAILPSLVPVVGVADATARRNALANESEFEQSEPL